MYYNSKSTKTNWNLSFSSFFPYAGVKKTVLSGSSSFLSNVLLIWAMKLKLCLEQIKYCVPFTDLNGQMVSWLEWWSNFKMMRTGQKSSPPLNKIFKKMSKFRIWFLCNSNFTPEFILSTACFKYLTFQFWRQKLYFYCLFRIFNSWIFAPKVIFLLLVSNI